MDNICSKTDKTAIDLNFNPSPKLDINKILDTSNSSTQNTLNLIKEYSVKNDPNHTDNAAGKTKTASIVAPTASILNNPSLEKNHPYINELLNQSYDMGLAGLKGGAAGLLSGGPVPYTLSMLAKDVIHKYPNSYGSKTADWYLRHFDKKTILDNRNKIVQSKIEEDTKKIDEIAKSDSAKLTNNLNDIEKKGLFGEIDIDQIEALDKRTKWLTNPDLLDKSLAKKNVLELEDLIRTEPKLFSKEELDLLLKRQRAVLDSAKLEKDMLEAEKVFGGKSAMIKNFSLGAGFDMGEFVVNDYIEHFTHNSGLFTQWSTNLLFVPAEEFLPGGIYTKLAYGAAIIGGSQLIDHYFPTQKYTNLEKVLKPNELDALLLAGACVMPVDGPLMRLALMGIAFVPGRIENYFANQK